MHTYITIVIYAVLGAVATFGLMHTGFGHPCTGLSGGGGIRVSSPEHVPN